MQISTSTMIWFHFSKWNVCHTKASELKCGLLVFLCLPVTTTPFFSWVTGAKYLTLTNRHLTVLSPKATQKALARFSPQPTHLKNQARRLMPTPFTDTPSPHLSCSLTFTNKNKLDGFMWGACRLDISSISQMTDCKNHLSYINYTMPSTLHLKKPIHQGPITQYTLLCNHWKRLKEHHHLSGH